MAVVYIDVENAAGQKLGNGPIRSASRWRSKMPMDKSGTFEFVMPARDPKSILVVAKRIVRCWTTINGQRTEMGAGIIDDIRRVVGDDGIVTLQVSGNDLTRELTYRTVHQLKLYTGGNPVTHATAVAAVEGYAPAGWTFTPDGVPPNDSIYGYFNGETVLAGAIKIAQKSQNHFYRGTGRSLVFASSFTPSGIRAIQARGNLRPTTCAIRSLTERIDTYDEINRIYPRGSGNADVQLTLRATTRVAPAGFTLNAAQNYIEYDAGVAEQLIERQVDYRDIGPIENTDADIVAASNALFDAALETLRRRSTEIRQATYDVQLEGCSVLLRPMQTILVTYRNLAAGLDVNEEFNILESTWQADESGVFTTGLIVSNVDRWPKTDVGVVVDGIEQGHVYQALPQLNANSYVIAYTKNVDADNEAGFRFRFGREITQLQQVLFEFQLLPFESTIKSIAAETVTSSAGGASTESASSGGSHTHTVTIPAHSHTVTIAQHSHTVTIAAHSHTVTVSSHTHTVTIPAHAHDIPDHQHRLTIIGNGPGALTYQIGYGAGGTAGGLRHNIDFSDHEAVTDSDSGETTSESGGGSTQTSSSGGGQTITSNEQAQTTPTSSTQAQTTPTSNELAQTTQTSSSNGTHTHTVTISDHTHTLTPVIVTQYGIFRDESVNLFLTDQLEYRVNGGSWMTLETADDAGDGWYQVDISDDVMDAITFRPLQTNNLIEVRALEFLVAGWATTGTHLEVTTAFAPHHFVVGDPVVLDAGLGSIFGTNVDGEYIVDSLIDIDTISIVYASAVDNGSGNTIKANKRATIDAQLSVRNTIQAVALV